MIWGSKFSGKVVQLLEIISTKNQTSRLGGFICTLYNDPYMREIKCTGYCGGSETNS